MVLFDNYYDRIELSMNSASIWSLVRQLINQFLMSQYVSKEKNYEFLDFFPVLFLQDLFDSNFAKGQMIGDND
mgnify:CR=1 FL=1